MAKTIGLTEYHRGTLSGQVEMIGYRASLNCISNERVGGVQENWLLSKDGSPPGRGDDGALRK